MQEIKILSEYMPIPKQRSKLLSHPKNKENICDFFFDEWTVKTATQQARSHNEANEAVASPKISKKKLPQMKNS